MKTLKILSTVAALSTLASAAWATPVFLPTTFGPVTAPTGPGPLNSDPMFMSCEVKATLKFVGFNQNFPNFELVGNKFDIYYNGVRLVNGAMQQANKTVQATVSAGTTASEVFWRSGFQVRAIVEYDDNYYSNDKSGDCTLTIKYQ